MESKAEVTASCAEWIKMGHEEKIVWQRGRVVMSGLMSGGLAWFSLSEAVLRTITQVNQGSTIL